jgi:peptidoglycan/LPS O-acetylase OafA/YrhL
MTAAGVPTGTDRRATFRADIEGMRAVAVVLVVLGHAVPALVGGGFVGVDVFFVISGFLITGLLAAELDRRGRIRLAAFYGRRARRLLPAAVLVLLASLLLAYLAVPRTRWAATGWDVVASALYVMNWRLAGQAVDYLAADDVPSLVQHYWSLAVEEQFYLLWPLLLVAVGALARSRGRRWRSGLLAAGVGLVAVPSLVWSVLLSDAEPARAYFVTTTRLWELALGGVLAVCPGVARRVPGAVAAVLAWCGLAAIVAAALLFGAGPAYPGQLALVPTLGTVAVLAGGPTAGRWGPWRLLGLTPLRVAGALSYPLYLWHWPLLVAAEARFGPLSAPVALAVSASAAVPAWLTYRYVERPVRASPVLARFPALALRLGATCTAVGVVAGLLFQFTVWPVPQGPTSALPAPVVAAGGDPWSGRPAVGAAVLGTRPRDDPAGAPVDRVEVVTPDPVGAVEDRPDVWRHGCMGPPHSEEPLSCVYGVRDSDVTVALVGDSHAANWLPALQDVAGVRRWRVLTYVKAGCPFADVGQRLGGPADASCAGWNRRVRAALTGPERPDLVVTSGYRLDFRDRGASVAERDEAMAAGFRSALSGLAATGTPVVVVRDTPFFGIDAPDCVSANRRRLTRCAVPRTEALDRSTGRAQRRAVSGLAHVDLVDLDDAICPTERCAAVIGGVLVYSDHNHLTASYVHTLAPRLDAVLAGRVSPARRTA